MAFEILPIELNEHIASYLSADKDVANFAIICRVTHSAIESHRCGLWRRLYASKFDVAEGQTGFELKMKYKVRCRALRRKTNWQKGNDRNENRVLKVLRDLICDSYAHMPLGCKAEATSKNILTLREYVQKSNLLDKVLSYLHRDAGFSPLLKTLQLILFHFQLDLTLGPANNTYGFSYSQKAVYSHPSKTSLFQSKDFAKVNIDFLMHTANFFKYHMIVPQAQTLYDLYSGLKPHERPNSWDSRLHQGPGVKKLGKHWSGSYAYLHDHMDMRRIRRAGPDAMSFVDSIDFHDGLQTLELDFSAAAHSTRWHPAFEYHLNALPPLPLCKKLDKLAKPDTCPKMTSFEHLGRPETTLEMPPATSGASSRQKGTFPGHDGTPLSSAPLTPTLTSPRRGIHYQQFRGSGTDAEPYHCAGILHPLPPQQGIPGWQRITLMKYFAPSSQDSSSSSSSPSGSETGSSYIHSPTFSSTSSSSTGTSPPANWPYPVDKSPSFTPVNSFPQIDYDDVNVDDGFWAYEGVVLPGGKIILGRWWSPMQNMDEMPCVGPFIFWEVDEA